MRITTVRPSSTPRCGRPARPSCSARPAARSSIRPTLNDGSAVMARLTVGLDIGTSAVRAAELDTSKSTPVLMTYGQVGLPPGSLVDGEIRDMTSVSEAIEKLWKNGQFSGSSVIVGIAGLRAITREIDLPYVPDDEVDSAVRFQSEEVIPFPPDQTILSSQILADYTNDEGAKMRRVLVAAAHVDLVNGVIEVVERAGLTRRRRRPHLVRAGPGRRRHRAARRGPGLRPARGHRLHRRRPHRGRRPPVRPSPVRPHHRLGRQRHHRGHLGLARHPDHRRRDPQVPLRRGGSPQIQAAERVAQPSMLELVDEIRNSHPVLRLAPRQSARCPGSSSPVAGPNSTGCSPCSRPRSASRSSPGRRSSGSTCPSSTSLRSRPPRWHRCSASPIGLALPEPDKAVKKFNLLPPEIAKKARMQRIQHRTLVGSIVVHRPAGGLRRLEVPSGPQRPEQCQRPPGEHRLTQRPGAEVRPGGGGQRRLHQGRRPAGLGAQRRGRLAAGAQQPDRHHSGQCGGAAPSTAPRTCGLGGAAAAGTAAAGHGRRPAAPSRPPSGPINLSVKGPGPAPVHLGGVDQRRVHVAVTSPTRCRAPPPAIPTGPSPSPSPSRSPRLPASARMRA